jgi:diguanylate cyclase (GGDEF)-like protein
MSRFLDVFGYQVLQAADAVQAIAAAESAAPDFLIVDATGDSPASLQLCRNIRRLTTGNYMYSLLLASEPDFANLTEALEAGFDDFLLHPLVFGELLARLRAGARVIEFERRLAQQTGVEPATELADAAALHAAIAEILAAPTAGANHLALVDLDFFGRARERHGRPASAELLQQVAEVIRAAAEGKFLAAVHANRFAIILPQHSQRASEDWGKQLLCSLGGHEFALGDEKLRITASCGIAPISPSFKPDIILQKAAGALKLAKSSGRNCLATSEEVDRETEAWNELAAGGKLFETTVARDVMIPCALLLSADESVEVAQTMLAHTHLSAAAVIDAAGQLVGLITKDQLANLPERPAKPRASNSAHLVRQVMLTTVTRFEETTPLAELLEFFSHDEQTLAVVVRDKCPTGILHCQSLAALNERLTADHFLPESTPTHESDYLVVCDPCLTE